jgi:hypothetical protein
VRPEAGGPIDLYGNAYFMVLLSLVGRLCLRLRFGFVRLDFADVFDLCLEAIAVKPNRIRSIEVLAAEDGVIAGTLAAAQRKDGLQLWYGLCFRSLTRRGRSLKHQDQK